MTLLTKPLSTRLGSKGRRGVGRQLRWRSLISPLACSSRCLAANASGGLRIDVCASMHKSLMRGPSHGLCEFTCRGPSLAGRFCPLNSARRSLVAGRCSCWSLCGCSCWSLFAVDDRPAAPLVSDHRPRRVCRRADCAGSSLGADPLRQSCHCTRAAVRRPRLAVDSIAVGFEVLLRMRLQGGREEHARASVESAKKNPQPRESSIDDGRTAFDPTVSDSY